MTNIQEKTDIENIHAEEYGTTRKEKYFFLSNLSKNLIEAIEEDELTAEFYEDCENTNAILKKYYQNQYRVEEFNTFAGWKKEGFKVKKGAKAFLLWSKPKKKEKTQEQEESKEQDGKNEKEKYYIAYLFSNLQVEEIQIKEVKKNKMNFKKALNLVKSVYKIEKG